MKTLVLLALFGILSERSSHASISKIRYFTCKGTLDNSSAFVIQFYQSENNDLKLKVTTFEYYTACGYMGCGMVTSNEKVQGIFTIPKSAEIPLSWPAKLDFKTDELTVHIHAEGDLSKIFVARSSGNPAKDFSYDFGRCFGN